MIPTRLKHNRKGFTLVELLVALIVTSIVLAAVAALAFAMGTADDSSNDTAVKQAQLRYATLRISEVIKYSKLVHSASESEIVLWRADDDPNDGMVNDTEKVYINAVPTGDGYLELQLREGSSEPVIAVPQCRNVEFVLEPALPGTKFVSVLFELKENDVWRKYQISATVRCKAG